MNDITQKSFGSLLDSLITADLRCFHAQDQIMDTSLSTEQRLAAAVRAQEQNAIRSALIKAIDNMMGQGDISPGGNKTYYTYFDDKDKNK